MPTASSNWAGWESWPCHSHATALWRADPTFHLGSTVELFLVMVGDRELDLKTRDLKSWLCFTLSSPGKQAAMA